ncbi:hypothetical protein Pelo_17495 [Pelomyxa schiedti]|nr:hypothetical protein Pelo_17495 [Pelomyxa schiedti]
MSEEDEQKRALINENTKLKGTITQDRLCVIRKGALGIVTQLGLAISEISAESCLGMGSNGSVYQVRVLPETHAEASEVALKMMFNYSNGVRTTRLQQTYDCEYLFLHIYPHWCFVTVYNSFLGRTLLSLIPPENRPYYRIVGEDRKRVEGSWDPDAIVMYDRTYFLTMELGINNLAKIVDEKFGRHGTIRRVSNPLETAHGMWILAFCCLCACSHMNTHGWFHDDIKLNNILLVQRPTTTIISHALRGDIWVFCDLGTSIECPTGEFICETGYTFEGNGINRSPEVSRPHPHSRDQQRIPLAKNDVWALGCVLFEVIAGIHPYYRHNEIDHNIFLASSVPFLIPDEFRGSTPISALVPFLLERDPNIRPTAAQALLICGAIMFLPPPHNTFLFSEDPHDIVDAINFFGQTDIKGTVESMLIKVLHNNLISLEPKSSSPSSSSASRRCQQQQQQQQQQQEVVPTVEQVCSLVFTNEALSDIDEFCSVLLAFCKRRAYYYHVI